MNYKEKIGKALVVAGIVTVLGGLTGSIYQVYNLVFPKQTEAVGRMIEVERELSFPTTAREVFENSKVRAHYLRLEDELSTFKSKPLVMEERIKYDSELEDFGRNQRKGTNYLLVALASTLPLGVGKIILDMRK